MKTALYTLLGCLISFSVFGSIHYVTPTGAGSMDATSWANAAPGTSLQAIINMASPGDSIWVACGTYKPTSGSDRSISFSMRDSISIFGGFIGTEANIAQRSFNCGPCSILSGDIGTLNDSTDNTYCVVVNIGLDSTAILDGFQVTWGNDDRSIMNHESGLAGGIYNGGSGTGGEGGACHPTYRNLIIANNYAAYGAGMFNNAHAGGSSSPTLENCIFAYNHSGIGGGGMDTYAWQNGTGHVKMTNCIFFQNRSDDRAGAMYCWGGQNGDCSPELYNCTFVNNSAVNIAGGVIVDNSNDLAGNPPFTGTASVTSINSIFWGNTSAAGPQFYILGNGDFTASYTSIDTLGQGISHPISGPGTGNLYTWPELLDTADGAGIDDCWMTADDGLTLQPCSNAINTGDSTINLISPELSGNMRIIGLTVDMGPYEYLTPVMNYWTGATDTDWFKDSNWSLMCVPDSLQSVVIPGTVEAPNQPVIHNLAAYCMEIEIRSSDGAIVELTGTGTLNVRSE